MAKKLKTYVYVNGEVYGPDSDVPAEVAEQITAPGVWVGESADDKSDAKPAAKSAAK